MEGKPVVLLLSIYPFVKPRHGGQVRVANIARVFVATGWKVKSLAIYKAEGFCSDSIGINDIPFPENSIYRMFFGRHEPLAYGLQAGKYATAEDGAFPLIEARLPPRIDAIHVEQPGLWPLAVKIKAMPQYQHAILVYGSQNIEAPLTRAILSDLGRDAQNRDVIAAIDLLERRAASEADVTIAVTSADAGILSAYGARKVVLAPNGVSPWSARQERIDYWRDRLPRAPWILYVASAHPPNFTGFTSCVGESLGCIPPDSRLVVVGGVCRPLYRALAATRWAGVNCSRLALLYFLSDADLAAVKSLAHAFLLPIEHGGGSNLKTAEALYSGAYVIGTDIAFRGFEDLADLPDVSIARTPKEFQVAIRDTLQRPTRQVNQFLSGDSRHRLLWDHCLAPIPEEVGRLLKRGKNNA